MCVYLLPGTVKRDVWRRVATEWPCLWPNASEWRRKRPASLPPTLSISWQKKATHWVRWCQTCQDRPSCTPFIPACWPVALFNATLSLSTTTQPQCLEVGLAKSYCFSSKAKDFNWKRDPEWKLTSLCRPLFWENTETHQGKENEMWSWWKKWVMFLKQMEEEVWHLTSLCFTYNGPGFFFSFSWVWQTDPI